jgi:hypothetical protein
MSARSGAPACITLMCAVFPVRSFDISEQIRSIAFVTDLGRDIEPIRPVEYSITGFTFNALLAQTAIFGTLPLRWINRRVSSIATSRTLLATLEAAASTSSNAFAVNGVRVQPV